MYICTLQISVNSLARGEVVVKDLQPGLEKIGRVLAGGHLPSVAKAVFSHSGLREHIVKKVFNVVNDECAALCSKSQPVSVFRHISTKQAETFSWKQFASELEHKAPTLFSILTYVVSRTDRRNQKKRGELEAPSRNLYSSYCPLERTQPRDVWFTILYLSGSLFL